MNLERIEHWVFLVSGSMMLISYIVWLTAHGVCWIVVELVRLGKATWLKIQRIRKATEAEE